MRIPTLFPSILLALFQGACTPAKSSEVPVKPVSNDRATKNEELTLPQYEPTVEFELPLESCRAARKSVTGQHVAICTMGDTANVVHVPSGRVVARKPVPGTCKDAVFNSKTHQLTIIAANNEIIRYALSDSEPSLRASMAPFVPGALSADGEFVLSKSGSPLPARVALANLSTGEESLPLIVLPGLCKEASWSSVSTVSVDCDEGGARSIDRASLESVGENSGLARAAADTSGCNWNPRYQVDQNGNVTSAELSEKDETLRRYLGYENLFPFQMVGPKSLSLDLSVRRQGDVLVASDGKRKAVRAEAGAYEIQSADGTKLSAISPRAGCPHCSQVERQLVSHDLKFLLNIEEVNLRAGHIPIQRIKFGVEDSPKKEETSLRFTELSSGGRTKTLLSQQNWRVGTLNASGDGKLVALTKIARRNNFDDHRLLIMDTSSGKVVLEQTLRREARTLYLLPPSDASGDASEGNNETLRHIVVTISGEAGALRGDVHVLLQGGALELRLGSAQFVATSPGGDYWFLGDYSGQFAVWRTKDMKPVGTLVLYSDGSWIAQDKQGSFSASPGGEKHLYSVKGPAPLAQPVAPVKPPAFVTALKPTE